MFLVSINTYQTKQNKKVLLHVDVEKKTESHRFIINLILTHSESNRKQSGGNTHGMLPFIGLR